MFWVSGSKMNTLSLYTPSMPTLHQATSLETLCLYHHDLLLQLNINILNNILLLEFYIFPIFRYVNYGRVEDIQKLEELGISLKGRIAISR